jgi:nicotinamide mononucleotide transporter
MVDHWFVQVMKRNESIYTNITAITGITLLGPILDSSTEVLQIIGQILMTLAYSQQWIFWILTNVITIGMWILVVLNDKTTITWVLPIIFMWFGFLVNSFYGYYKWTIDAKEKREWSILKKRRNN